MTGLSASAESSPRVVAWDRDLPETAPPLLSDDRVLLIGAHPDDETIGAGRLVAGHDGEVRAVTLSRGESCVVSRWVDQDELAARRLAEWRAASRFLGAEPLETPRWPDGELASYETEIVDVVGDLLVDVDVLVTVWRHDPHPDHRAAGRAAAVAAAIAGVRVVEYPVWAPYWMDHEQVAALEYRICVTPHRAPETVARARALAEYTSQTRPLLPGTEPVVPPRMLARHDRQLLALRTDVP